MNWAWITICVLGYAFLVNGCELKLYLISYFQRKNLHDMFLEYYY